ncbi:MAG TPA: GNAT family N-acetyltransferase [Anaerolineales bacterium]|nr:GNAT family N-acetyltransferase [Anaerolineales bacterium]
MNNSIHTQRLQLIPLDVQQPELVLQDIESFEKTLNIVMIRSWMDDRVERAIRMKIEKMKVAEPSQHSWFTYWLIVIKEENTGAGMLGFKGFPDRSGSTEIGYGIDAAYQGKGYMIEAVQALIDWAFTYRFCQVITASEVENPASRRLLERLGAKLVSASEHSTSWEIRNQRGI